MWTREAFAESLNNFDQEMMLNDDQRPKQSQSIIQRYLEMQQKPMSGRIGTRAIS